MGAVRSPVRRVRRGAVSLEIDPAAARVVLRCHTHRVHDEVTLRGARLGRVLVDFLTAHEGCSGGSTFNLDRP